MPTLYLVRHAIAEEHAPSGSDADRALTSEGEAKMRRAARGLKALGLAPDWILASPLLRAQQTAGIVREVLAPSVEVVTCHALAPGHRPSDVLRALPHDELPAMMLVGHEPDLGCLASFLLTKSPTAVAFAFKKGAVAAIEVTELPPQAPGHLLSFLTPKQLRALTRD